MKIGIAGIGKMGQAIGGRLLGLGHTLHVWNRTEARAQPLLSAGALWAANPQALAEQVDVVISLITNEDAIESVYFGEHGLTRGPVAGWHPVSRPWVRATWSAPSAAVWVRPKKAN
jgi:3-hydroxyisobutyrate dehydrogenase